MSKKWIFLVCAVVVIGLVWIFSRSQQQQAVRTGIVVGYLDVAKIMSSFMMETAISSKVTVPSRYSLESLLKTHLAFQKKFHPYRNLRLYENIRVSDFLASEERTVKGFYRLIQIDKKTRLAEWKKEVQKIDQLFFHNAVYCVMAVGKDKTTLSINSRQRDTLRQVLYGTFGGIIMEYAKRQPRPPFVNHLFLIAASLEARQPLSRFRQ